MNLLKGHFDKHFFLHLINFLISLTPLSFILSLESHIWLLGYEAFVKVTSITRQLTINNECHYAQYQMGISMSRKLDCYCLLRILEIRMNRKIEYVARHSDITVLVLRIKFYNLVMKQCASSGPSGDFIATPSFCRYSRLLNLNCMLNVITLIYCVGIPRSMCLLSRRLHRNNIVSFIDTFVNSEATSKEIMDSTLKVDVLNTFNKFKRIFYHMD